MLRSRPLAHALALVAAATALALALGLAGAAPALAREHPRPWAGHPGRHLVSYTVHRGDTATGLAVRFHAWTAELLALNHLHRDSTLRIGRHLLIPVVDPADRPHRHQHHGKHPSRHPVKQHHHAQHRHAQHHKTKRHKKARHHHPRKHRARHPWRHAGMSRAQVEHAIVRAARRQGVPPRLALAIAWQESGWQQHVVSPAGAIGVMQLLGSTSRWMSGYAGRLLNPYGSYDNILGGVLLLRVLRAETRHDRNAIAAYYEGLGAVRHRGWYDDTRRYVRSVHAIERNLRRTGSPVG